MRLLDLFCGAGGAGMGYHRAGFEVVGVDIEPQPNYPFWFCQADALEFVAEHGHKFDVIHASPPCQGYSKHITSDDSLYVHSRGKSTPRYIRDLRELIFLTGRPCVIENVIGARDELRASVLLCGSMFGLPIRKHRIFEMSFFMWQPVHPRCTGMVKRAAAALGVDERDLRIAGKSRRSGCLDTWRNAIGMPWAKHDYEMSEAIPPAYTEWIGKQLMTILTNQLA